MLIVFSAFFVSFFGKIKYICTKEIQTNKNIIRLYTRMARAKKEKLVIYQVLMRLFGNQNTTCKKNGTIEENGCGKMSSFNTSALNTIKQLGCNAVWYTGIIQQASQTDYSAYGIPKQNPNVLKGVAGSPYAISDYYSVSCDLADDPAKRMDEFDDLVKRTHKAGLKMFIDFVPNHVARNYKSVTAPKGVEDFGASDNKDHAFNPQNNFYYIPGKEFAPQFGCGEGEGRYSEFPAKATGNDCFNAHPSINDWYETVKLNYGVDYCGGGRYHFDPIPDTWNKMLDILLYWCKKGVDGFRCDMVFMVPVDFWHWAIAKVKEKYPRTVFIAEIYDPAIYRSYIHYGGFDYLYDKVGLYDTLRAIVEGRESATAITRRWQEIDDIHDNMVNFLENHDEQRVASDFFAGEARKGFPALVVSALMRTNPFMCYFGQELGERGMDEEGFSGRDGRTTIFDYWGVKSVQALQGKDSKWRRQDLPKHEREIREFYCKVLNIANQEDAIVKGGFYDLQYANHDNAGYNVHRHYAFLRNFGRDVILVVANFEHEDREISVNVPKEAWEFVGVSSRRRHIENLLTGEWDFFYHDTTVPMKYLVPANGAIVLKIQGT